MPLTITIMLLLSFKPISAVLWYCVLLCSAALLTIGSLFYLLPQRGNSNTHTTGLTLIQIGGITVVILLLIFGFQKWKKDNDRRERLRVAPEELLDSEDVSEFNLKWLKNKKFGITKSFAVQSRNSIIAFFLIYIGGISANLFSFSFLEQYFYYYSYWVKDIQNIPEIFGAIIFTIGIVFTYNWFSNLFQAGRDLNTKINAVIKKDFVKIVLILLGLVYIPTTTSLLSMTLCEPVECPMGQELANKISTTTTNFNSIWYQFREDVNSKDVCKNCVFDLSCPTDLQNQLCPVASDSRLSKDLTISCNSEIYPFYFPGIFLCLFSVTFGIPYLYYKLITTCTKFIKEIPTFVTDLQERWMIQAKISKNCAKSLYSAFERRFRYYKLFMILHRLLIVTTFVFASRDKTGLGVTFGITCIHCVALIINGYSRPFFSRAEDLLCLSCIGINTVNGVCTILLALGIEVSESAIYIIGILNIALPAAFIVLGGYLQSKSEKKLKAAMREEKQILLKEIGDQDKRAPRELREHPELEFIAIDSEILHALDTTLDGKLLKILVNFFLFMGITTFIGLCLAIFDVTYNMNRDNTSYDVPGSDRTVDSLPFGPYTSWGEFTENCGCMPEIGINGINYKSEVWKCLESQYSKEEFSFKSYIRENNGINGYGIRNYCSSTFTDAICEEPSNKNGKVYPTLCSNATGIETTAVILHQLW